MWMTWEETMIRLIAVAFALVVATSAQAISPHRFISQTEWSRKSAKHAVPVCTWSMGPACVLLLAGMPPGVRLGCAQWVGAASNEMNQLGSG